MDCGNPKIENIAGSQILKQRTFPPLGVVEGDWLSQSPTQWSCCGDRVVNNVVTGGCETITVTTNIDRTPTTLVYNDGRSAASLSTVSTTPWVQEATFTFDGRFQAKKSMSGLYRFTIGCACDA